MNRQEKERYIYDLQRGRFFEDFASEVLYDHGIAVGIHRSRRYQFEVGESRAGVEFKLDRHWRQTGNLFLEVEARTSEEGDFAPSGIFRNDNALFWCIGDTRKFWLLPRRRILYLEPGLRHVDGYTDTGSRRFHSSVGVLLSTDMADMEAAAIFEHGQDIFCTECGRVRRKGEKQV